MPAKAVSQATQVLAVLASSLASQLRFFGCCRDLCLAVIPCRSWLASEDGESGEGGVGCAGVIAGKPAQVFWVLPGFVSGGDPL